MKTVLETVNLEAQLNYLTVIKIYTILAIFSITITFSQDWSGIPVPADPGVGKAWVLQDNVSDDFNYSAPASDKGSTFLLKWDDWYHNGWSGPGLTTWARNHSLVEGGELKLIASRYQTNRVNAGVIHSRNTVVYPVYIEIRAKIMNSVLANGGWMLSPDDTQEIDFMEGYGATLCGNCPSGSQDQTWYAQRMHMSHHVFVRDPFQDWQPSEYNDVGSNPVDVIQPTWITRDDGSGMINWKDDFHRYGVYWKDPTHLYYYIDGNLVTYREGMDEIDPLYFTNTVNPGDSNNDTRTGLSKAMDILFSVEDQDWRSNNEVTPTDTELSNTNNHTLRVDWIRAYKPESTASVDEWFTSNLQVNPNPFDDYIELKADVLLKAAHMYTLSGGKVLVKEKINKRLDTISTASLSSGIYVLKVESDSGLWSHKKVVKK
ncbi:T9SS type A sorting domain-containing protein [Tamlana fucoidanivorans]|uniref:T9SS type A sorting domain-containing protein n=1 Tax=Allotamlana fucoidanivorans TaxID=2583814 RepID=A0A5C4SIE0_9FLAO|nr:T9SS type A sorting domain-containing protein [Tamlana fucoidanivorans]TNJ42599.1 T9SS type A sorting domain-containing protein [Tamlana fucoidanivorans]